MQNIQGPWVSSACFRQIECAPDNCLIPYLQTPQIGMKDQTALLIKSRLEKHIRLVETKIGIFADAQNRNPIVGVMLLRLNEMRTFWLFLDLFNPSDWHHANAGLDALPLVLYDGCTIRDVQVITNAIARFQSMLPEDLDLDGRLWTSAEFDRAVRSIQAEFPNPDAMFAMIEDQDSHQPDSGRPANSSN
jgi:hypothetical protein